MQRLRALCAQLPDRRNRDAKRKTGLGEEALHAVHGLHQPLPDARDPVWSRHKKVRAILYEGGSVSSGELAGTRGQPYLVTL